jgi:hypothetical protein
VGLNALVSNTTASENTAVGNNALLANTTGTENVVVGTDSGDAITTGSQNTFVGMNSGGAATTGTFNAFYGRSSGSAMTTGSKNTIIGSYNGNQDGLDIRTSSNNIVLSDGDGNVKFYNNSGDQYLFNTTSLPSASVQGFGLTGQTIVTSATSTSQREHHQFFNGNGQVGSIKTSGSGTSYNTSSDYRLKENVDYIWDATTRLKQLKPARFNFIADADTTVDGFLAHEAQAVVPEAVTGTKDEVDDDGNAVMQGIDQSKLVPLLVKTIQELEARITALEGA